MLDLSKLNTKDAAEKGADLILRHPGTGEVLVDEPTKDNPTPIPWTLTLLGMDSAVYQNAQHVQQTRRVAKATRVGRSSPATGKEIEDDAIDLMVKVTRNMKGITKAGKPYEFTEANVRALYVEYPWAREQASNFITDRGNFLGNS